MRRNEQFGRRKPGGKCEQNVGGGGREQFELTSRIRRADSPIYLSTIALETT